MCVCACPSPILDIHSLHCYSWSHISEQMFPHFQTERMKICLIIPSYLLYLNYLCNCYINTDHIFFRSMPKRNLPFFWQDSIFWERCMTQSLSMLGSDRVPRASLHVQVTACVPICCSTVRPGKTRTAWLAKRGTQLLLKSIFHIEVVVHFYNI